MPHPHGTAADAANRLTGCGGDVADEPLRLAQFDLALARFARVDSGAPQYLFWVPGRLEMFGKHTDYAGGRSLVAAVPRGFAVAAGGRTDGRVQVVDAARDQTVMFDAKGDMEPHGSPAPVGWRHYVATVVRRLRRNFPNPSSGATIVFASDLPRASGMSSSSALMVAVASALVRVVAIDRRPEWAATIRSPLHAASYFACIENGMSFETLPGDAGVGTHGGSEDHAAILSGRPGHLSVFGFVPLRRLDDVALPGAWRFVLTPSGIAADKTGGAMGPYNRLARGAQVLLDRWNRDAASPAPSLAAALSSSPDASSHLRELLATMVKPEWPRAVLLDRLEHFVREDGRVGAAAAALRSGDALELGRLAADSQRDADLLLGNQVPETVALCSSARASGAFAASSFGAGFGGSVWALVPCDEADAFARRWHPQAFVARPAPPLTEL